MGIEGRRIEGRDGGVEREALELFELARNRPSKELDPQGYYTYKARKHQIWHAFFLKQAESEQQRGHQAGHQAQASELNLKANVHLQKRDQCIEKVHEFWLKAVESNKNPPHPDMMFIHLGVRLNQLLA